MKGKLIAMAILSGIPFIGLLPNFILGIIVLATTDSGNSSNRGMQTAAGVIGILGGLWIVNSIVAGIAASKED